MRIKSRAFLVLVLPALSVWLSASEAASVDAGRMSLPTIFEKNMGQEPSRYQFISRHSSVEARFSRTSVDLTFPDGPRHRRRITFKLLGSREEVAPEGRDLLSSVSNYLLGNDPTRWIRGVPNNAEVVYRNIYPDIDLIFHGSGESMEHDFRIAPNGNPDQIGFVIEGADRIALDSSGNLEISLANGKLIFQKPTAYQQTARGRGPVDSAFVLNPDGSVRFHVGIYDRKSALIIDPVFVFSTYLAGSSLDNPVAVTTDSAGNVYVTGYTDSPNFPIENGIEATVDGSPDGFVSKLDPTGHTLLYSTYLGGSSRNYGNAIAVDANGNIIVAGASSSNDFPHAGAVPALTCEGNNDCFFLVSLKPDGSAFNYAGLIGGIEGTAVETGQSGAGILAVDADGNAYLASVTDDSNFEITPGTLSTTVTGYPYNSTFVLKADPTGALVYSTIVPGTAQSNLTVNLNNVFVPAGISVDTNGQVTIAGTSGPGLPSTAGVIQPTFPNDLSVQNASAGFVLQLNATASAINYATYVPGTDTIGGLAIDGQGNSYVAGGTSETTLPVSGNAYQKTIKSGANCTCNSGFIVKLNAMGTSIPAATYLEGTPTTGNEGTSFGGIVLDSNSNVFVGGMTGSTDFPLVDPFVSLWVYGEAVSDMVLAEMSPDLSSLLFGSFLSSTDQVFPASQFSALTVDSQNNLIVTGLTLTTDFPTTPGSYEPTPPTQAGHAFVAKLDLATAAASVCPDSWSVTFGSVNAKQSNTQVVHVTNCGDGPLTIASFVSSASTVAVQQSCGTIQPGTVCPISLTYTPVDSSALAGMLTLTDNTVISPQVIQFSGQGIAPQINPSSGTVNFGHLLVNTTGVATQLLFSNTGNTSLSITAATVNGDFTINQNVCVSSLPPGGYCFITITFAPTASGTRTGTLTILSNDPVYPQAGINLVGVGDTVYPSPLITSLGSPTAQINNGPITVQVMGSNFYPASVVAVNGTPQSTMYLNGEQLQATLSAGVTSAIGEVAVTVVNPSPGGGTGGPVTLTLYEVINVDAAFLASVPGSPLIYASLPSSSSTNPNTVISINPATGALGTPIPVGNNPGLLAASSDGSYLFVVSNQDQTLQRINLSSNTVDQTFPFPPNNTTCCGPLAGADLKVVPESPQELVLALEIPGYGSGEMALYTSTGLVNYVPTTTSVGTVYFSSFAYAGSPSTIYALPFSNAPSSYFNVITINAQGLQFTPNQAGNYQVNNTTGAEVVSDGSLLYTSAGEVWNPATQTQVGSFPVTTYNDTSYPNLYNLVLDTSSDQLFVIGSEPYGGDSSSLVLSAYSQSSLNLTGALAFPQVLDPLVNNLVQWGANGFAFLAQSATGNSEAVYLTTSSLKAAVTNPVPQLTSLNPTSISQGSSGLVLTLNGQGFTGASVVMWNGSGLQTTYVSNSVLTALVPTTDLSTGGTASITVYNPAPGGGTSSAIAFTISPLAPLISFSSSAVSFSNQQIGTSSSTQTVAVQNSGTATLNISGISITGTGAASFHQTNTCGSTLAAGANCVVSLVFTPAAAGLQNARLAFADNAIGSPQTMSISGTGTGLGLAAASGSSTSATVAAGASATYNLVIGGAGVAGTATITCTGAPTGANCSVPASVSLSAAAAAPLNVTVTTTSRTSAAAQPVRAPWFWAITVFGLLAVPSGWRKNRMPRWLNILPLSLLILVGSCGGGSLSTQTGTQSNPKGTSAGQYNLSITASAGSGSQSLSLSLTVQ